MAEDSGAFKTNPAKSRQIRHFVISGNTVAAKHHRPRKRLSGLPAAFILPNCNNRHGQRCGIFEPA